MADYSVETCRALERAFADAGVLRPMRVRRHDPGTVLVYQATGVSPARQAEVTLRVERFVGGGFAGQVYRTEVLSLRGEAIPGLEVGGHYAVKILVPPTGGKRLFRDALFRAGFQGAFAPQVNPAACRAGAIWQKLIRRGALVRLGGERAVVDVLATFFDERLGSCGEISEWIEGRQWRFEVDDDLHRRRRLLRGKAPPGEPVGSPEYLAKRRFMRRLVGLLHEMGARELARQYEWWTCKSQPNVLKRLECEGDPAAGLTAVDFRAGLALLAFMPMSPGDVKLILAGLARGSLVQFDRGDLGRLRRFVDAHAGDFADLRGALAELEDLEDQYRRSLPDVTHHHVRLLYSRRLWSGIREGLSRSWEARGLTDERAAASLRRSRTLTILFALLGALIVLGPLAGAGALVWGACTGTLGWMLAALAAGAAIGAPLASALLRQLWGRADLRRHYGRMLTSLDYLRRGLRARAAERLIAWHRAGAVSSERAMKLLDSPWRFLAHAVFFGFLPGRLHRFLTDRRYAWSRIRLVLGHPLRLIFDPAAREQYLRQAVAEGRENGMLSDEEAREITGRIREPFIQKYLQSLAVHLCTLPVTQMVSVTLAIYVAIVYGQTWKEAWGYAIGILVLFQVTPISPGSLSRGLYVVYLVVRERNLRDYGVAVLLAFFKYIGYLAFPVQMAYRYPALARFMAGRWATGAVHIVPVFGERGALLEHAVFDGFYNRLLTWRRRFREKDALRRGRRGRRWHLGVCALAGLAALAGVDLAYARAAGYAPMIWSVWYLALPVAALAGAASALGAGGTSVGRRIAGAAAAAAALGVAHGLLNSVLGLIVWPRPGAPTDAARIVWAFAVAVLWRVLLFGLAAALAAFAVEVAPAPPRSDTTNYTN